MSKIAIALTHGHAAKWLQTSVFSMKNWKNEVQADIYVACSWPGHASVRAITETPIGDGVTLIDCTRRLHSHATGLEHILEHIWPMEYDYMFTCETDCRALRDGWLDWFYGFLKDNEKVGMAGFFWEEGNNHYNINPSGTLYRMDMLRKYHLEARKNSSPMFWHPRGNRHDSEMGMDPTIKDVVGCFAETRGIYNPSDEQKEYILRGIPQAAWYEPGAWLFIRSIGEWEHVRVPVEHAYTTEGGVYAPEGTFYGGRKDPYFVHYWGGTRTYDFLKHPVTDSFVKGGAAWWIRREDALWKGTVPEEYRAIVHQLNIEAQVEEKMRENLGFFIPEVM